MNLLIVETPFQLISSYELIDYFNLKNNILVVIENKYGKENNKQLEDLIKEGVWKDIIYIRERSNRKNKSSFFDYVNVIKKLKKYKFDKLSFGSYGQLEQVIVGNINAKDYFLIDDGTAILQRYNYIKNKEKSKFLKRLRFMLFGLKPWNNKTINFFTMFNLKPFEKSKVIIHNFNRLKRLYNLTNKPVSNDVYIIGQHYVQLGILSNKAYDKFLNTVCDNNLNANIYYMSHRYESQERLNYIKDKFPQITIIKNNQPGEFFFLNLAEKPKRILGLNSTLLFSLNKIFNDLSIQSYQFNNENINPRSLDLFRRSAKEYIENGIEIKDI